MLANKPRARRKRLSREETRAMTRDRLLQAAEEVFSERGFHGASIEEIVERAGYTSGAFYSNFENKEELFLALFDARNAELLKDLQDFGERAGSPEDFFAALRARGAGRVGRSDRFAISLEFVLFCLRNPDARRKLATRERAVREAFANLAKARLEQDGQSLPMPSADLGLLMLAMEQGYNMQHHVDPETVRAGALVDSLELVFKGLAALSQPPSTRTRPRSAR
jgi:AcrR family transcriptional regulator